MYVWMFAIHVANFKDGSAKCGRKEAGYSLCLVSGFET